LDLEVMRLGVLDDTKRDADRLSRKMTTGRRDRDGERVALHQASIRAPPEERSASRTGHAVMSADRSIAIDAMPYSVYKHEIRNGAKQRDERRGGAAAAAARAQAAVPTGASGNPAGRRRGSRNEATLAAATLLDSEALADAPSRRGGARRRHVGDEAV